MSETRIFAAFDDGDMQLVGDVRNAHRGAMFVWRTVAARYLLPPGCAGMERDLQLARILYGDSARLFGLVDDPRLSDVDRLVLLTTCDHHYVRPENMLAVAEALERFEELGDGDGLREQAAIVREAHQRGARVVAWQSTTSAPELDWAHKSDGEPFNVDDHELVAGFEIKPRASSSSTMTTMKLRNGSEYPRAHVAVMLLTLRKLLATKPIVFFELVMRCRDGAHACFGNTEQQLIELSLLQPGGRPHQAVADVVLSAVEGDGLDMQLGDPTAKEGA